MYNSSFRKHFDVIYFAHTYCSFCVFKFYKILFSNFDLCFVSFGEKDHWLKRRVMDIPYTGRVLKIDHTNR